MPPSAKQKTHVLAESNCAQPQCAWLSARPPLVQLLAWLHSQPAESGDIGGFGGDGGTSGGDGGGASPSAKQRAPQSLQSVPSSHSLYCEFSPPSSLAHTHTQKGIKASTQQKNSRA